MVSGTIYSIFSDKALHDLHGAAAYGIHRVGITKSRYDLDAQGNHNRRAGLLKGRLSKGSRENDVFGIGAAWKPIGVSDYRKPFQFGNDRQKHPIGFVPVKVGQLCNDHGNAVRHEAYWPVDAVERLEVQNLNGHLLFVLRKSDNVLLGKDLFEGMEL